MNKTFNLLFFIKKSKIKANGTAPIYLRITIDGIPKEISSKRTIQPERWEIGRASCRERVLVQV